LELNIFPFLAVLQPFFLTPLFRPSTLNHFGPVYGNEVADFGHIEVWMN